MESPLVGGFLLSEKGLFPIGRRGRMQLLPQISQKFLLFNNETVKQRSTLKTEYDKARAGVA
jgi:hypothetical protein